MEDVLAKGFGIGVLLVATYSEAIDPTYVRFPRRAQLKQLICTGFACIRMDNVVYSTLRGLVSGLRGRISDCQSLISSPQLLGEI